MGRQIIKPERDVDFYIEWSSIVEAPTAFGPREWMLDHLVEDYRPDGQRYLNERAASVVRLDRADESGSSAFKPFGCTWDEDGEIYQQQGTLPRSKMREACGRLGADESADLTDLLTPFDD